MRDFARERKKVKKAVNVDECENLWEIFQKLLDFVYAAATELMVWF